MHGQDLLDATNVLRRELNAAAAASHDGQIENTLTLIRSFEVWANVHDRYPKLTALIKKKATAVERAVASEPFAAAAREVSLQYGNRLWQAVTGHPSTGCTRPEIAAADVANLEQARHEIRPIIDQQQLLGLKRAIGNELRLTSNRKLSEALEGLLGETESAISQTDDVYGESVRITSSFCKDRKHLESCLSTSLVGPAHVQYLVSGVEWVESKATEVGIIKAFNWSVNREPATWLELIAECGDRISRTTFYNMHNGLHAVELRKHSESTTKKLSLDLDDLGKLGYRGN